MDNQLSAEHTLDLRYTDLTQTQTGGMAEIKHYYDVYEAVYGIAPTEIILTIMQASTLIKRYANLPIPLKIREAKVFIGTL